MYRFLRGIGRILYFFRGWQIFGRENLPASGGFIIAANHISGWDPILLACAIKPEVYYMGKEELFTNPLAAWFFGQIHAFPVKRGMVDRRAIRKSLDILQSGQVLGIFPEGTRVEENEKMEPHSGIALLALKARVPVVPANLQGSRQGKPRAIIGKPMYFEAYYDMKSNSALLNTISQQVMQEVDRLANLTGGE